MSLNIQPVIIPEVNILDSEYTVSLYGMSVQHPKEWIARFGKVLYREHGVMDILEPSSKCEALFTVMWRPYQSLFLNHSFEETEVEQSMLQKGFKSFASPLGRGKKDREIPDPDDPEIYTKARVALQSYKNKVRAGFKNDFGEYKLLEDEETTFNTHYAIKEVSSFTAAHGVIKKSKIKVRRQSFYFVCPESKRLIILHSSVSLDDQNLYKECFDRFLATFRCH